MKKIIFILFLFLPSIVFAYENEYFKVDIDDTYNEVSINNTTYIWTSKETNDLPIITINISNNDKQNLHNYKEYNEKDIDNYKQALKNEFNKELSKYDIQTNINTINKITINNLPSIYYEAFSNTKDIYGYDIYQYNYSFTTSNYISSITYSSDKKSNELEQIIKSFEIKDTAIESKTFFEDKNNIIFISGISIGILLFIISELIKKRKSA